MVDNDEGEGGEQENKKININYSTQFKAHGRKTRAWRNQKSFWKVLKVKTTFCKRSI